MDVRKGYRLPTEAECPMTSTYGEYLSMQEATVDEVAWYVKIGGRQTHPVGQKKPNGFGLYDMNGNVWEWVWDWWLQQADYSDLSTRQ